ncbi:peptidyl-prolyl cis-trans isomerase [Aquiflexum lacus]|uniref:peptidyl-prolyl cis-trans isomerase n=1 Tax=Aquiflexum lacus TaxID=2483805 RepID=UPI001E616D99|nr:peptidyl-prolyl cis-trans isomerase [Aquiflexum lacus]
MLQSTNKWLFLALMLSISSCDLFKFKSSEDTEEDAIIASVGNQNLRKSELAFIKAENNSPEDSINIASRYVQSWIRKQLMIIEAGKSMSFDEAEINRKLLDYKYALMVYEFEKKYVEDNLTSEISQKEIEDYYQANQTNFSLKEIIVRTNFLKTDKAANAQNRNMEKLLRSNDPNDGTALKDLASKQASNYFLEDSTWVRFEDIIINTPLANHANMVELLRNNKLIITDDERYRYYFKILEYKLQDQLPPLEFVRDEITKILTNRKRIALVEQLQKEIYNQALENEAFKIYE